MRRSRGAGLFLGELSRGLEQAIGVRVVYRALLARGEGRARGEGEDPVRVG